MFVAIFGVSDDIINYDSWEFPALSARNHAHRPVLYNHSINGLYGRIGKAGLNKLLH